MGLLRFTPDGWAEVLRIRLGLTSEQCDKMHMTGTLQKVIDAGRVAIAAVPYEGEWGRLIQRKIWRHIKISQIKH